MGVEGMLGSSFPKGLSAFGDRCQLRDKAIGLPLRTRVFSDAELTLESKPLEGSRLVRRGDSLALGATVDGIQIAPTIARMRFSVVSRSINSYYVLSKGIFDGSHVNLRELVMYPVWTVSTYTI